MSSCDMCVCMCVGWICWCWCQALLVLVGDNGICRCTKQIHVVEKKVLCQRGAGRVSCVAADHAKAEDGSKDGVVII